MPKLLLAPGQRGWPHFQRLLVALLRFLEPYLRNADLTDAIRLLYKVPPYMFFELPFKVCAGYTLAGSLRMGHSCSSIGYREHEVSLLHVWLLFVRVKSIQGQLGVCPACCCLQHYSQSTRLSGH